MLKLGKLDKMPSSPGDRLREARERVGFSSAAAAAKAIGVPIATYTGHEANHRGFPAKKAALYAKEFHVSVNWLLFGEDNTNEQKLRVPVTAIIDSGKSQVRELTGKAVAQNVEAPNEPKGITRALQVMPGAQHMFAGWTFFLEDPSPRLSEIAEDKLCLIGLDSGQTVLAKPRRASSTGLYHLYFFGDDPKTDVKINWVSRVLASRM
jgi:hypothetical protein